MLFGLLIAISNRFHVFWLGFSLVFLDENSPIYIIIMNNVTMLNVVFFVNFIFVSCSCFLVVFGVGVCMVEGHFEGFFGDDKFRVAGEANGVKFFCTIVYDYPAVSVNCVVEDADGVYVFNDAGTVLEGEFPVEAVLKPTVIKLNKIRLGAGDTNIFYDKEKKTLIVRSPSDFIVFRPSYEKIKE